MTDHKTMSPIKRISLTFLTITALGVTSSWLSSCSDTTAATADHANIERRLASIEAKIDDQDTVAASDLNETVTTMANLTATLSGDIGKMSKEIGYMADRIVETENLIVQVITNQTDSATTVIQGAKMRDPNITGPDSPLIKVYQGPAQIDFSIGGGGTAGSNGSNGSPISLVAGGGNPTTTTAPNFNIAAVRAAAFTSPYVLMMSTNGIFGGTTSTSVTIGNGKTLNTGWAEMITILGLAANNKAYFAVKTIAGGQLSAVSNTLNVTIQ